MPPTDVQTHRSSVARRTKPVLVREFASGAVLGALVWLAVTTLGLHATLHLSAASGLAAAALLGALLGVTRYRLVLWLVGGALAALFAIVAFTPIVVRPAQALVRSDPIPSPPLKLDAVVVLSGGLTADGLVGYSGIERLLSGVRLARSTGTAVLVTTRVRHPANLDVSSDADQKRLVELLGSGLRLFVVPDVFSTRDEALRVRDLARQQRWGRVAVVTSPSHSRRACGTFEKGGLRVTCVPAESREVAFRTLATPGDRIEAFKLWIYEMAGTVNYRLKGWLP
ncbi:MAG: YdcF family protein [Gemmatimonadaceae bacterium]